jgi:hypothetical protein
MTNTDVWIYRPAINGGLGESEVGYGVEAIDGSIGKIDETTTRAGSGYVIVDTGPWIFGKKVLLPAGVISDVDREMEKVYVDRTKDEIKNAPEFDESLMHDETYHSRVGSYYGAGYPGSDN